jgi:RNA polymerase sigma-70 factor, ECF subfamily
MDRSTALAVLPREAAESMTVPSTPLTLEAIYDNHIDFVWRTLARLGVAHDRMDDAAQDVFVVVHRKLSEFEHRSSVKTWLFRIVQRVAHDHRRARRRKDRGLGREMAEDPEELSDEASGGPLQHVEQADAIRLLERLVSELDRDKREVFMLSELEQMTAPEISETLGIPVAKVYCRLRTAREQFEAALARMRSLQSGGLHGTE